MKKKVLIDGAFGFVGKHLTAELENNGYEVFGVDRDKMNVCDYEAVHATIRRIKPDYIFHLAAIAYVPSSWQDPKLVFEVNTIGTLNLLNAVRSVGIDPVIHLAGCYSEDTRLVTSGGFKTYKEIKEGDLVLSINPETEVVEYKKVNRIIVQKYKGKMFHFVTRSVDLLVTPNHSMLIKKGKGKKMRFVKAIDISGRNILPVGAMAGEFRRKLHEEIGPEIFYLVGLFIGDGYLVPSRRTFPWSGLSREEYLARSRDVRGCFRKTNRTLQKTYESKRAFLAIPRGDKARVKAENVLNKLGVKYHAYDNELYFVPPENVHKILVQCGKCASNKTIPLWMLDFPKKCLVSLFNGLIDSDGNYHSGGYGYTTISEKLVSSFVVLCRLIGKWVTYSKCKSRKVFFKKDNRTIMSKPCYNFSVSEGEKTLTCGSKKQKNIYQVDWDGVVWCLDVEENHNFLVERNGKVAFCGNSSEEFGLVHEDELPINENNQLRPLSPYGVSKIALDMLGYQYHKSYGMKIVRTRAFNHEGYGRGEEYMPSSFAKQIVEIEKKLKEPIIYHGDLTSRRDITDVRDMVRAYRLAVEKCDYGEVYVIGSGECYSAKDVLDTLLRLSGIEVTLKQDPKRMRPSDVKVLQSNSSKFREKTGWKPEHSLEETLSEELRFWREKL